MDGWMRIVRVLVLGWVGRWVGGLVGNERPGIPSWNGRGPGGGGLDQSMLGGVKGGRRGQFGKTFIKGWEVVGMGGK